MKEFMIGGKMGLVYSYICKMKFEGSVLCACSWQWSHWSMLTWLKKEMAAVCMILCNISRLH